MASRKNLVPKAENPAYKNLVTEITKCAENKDYRAIKNTVRVFVFKFVGNITVTSEALNKAFSSATKNITSENRKAVKKAFKQAVETVEEDIETAEDNIFNEFEIWLNSPKKDFCSEIIDIFLQQKIPPLTILDHFLAAIEDEKSKVDLYKVFKQSANSRFFTDKVYAASNEISRVFPKKKTGQSFVARENNVGDLTRTLFDSQVADHSPRSIKT
jgi:hypothetical protein